MQKFHLFIVMGLLTVSGVFMSGFAMFPSSQQPAQSLGVAWDEMWNQHPMFGWVMLIYFAVIVICDICCVAGLLHHHRNRQQYS